MHVSRNRVTKISCLQQKCIINTQLNDLGKHMKKTLLYIFNIICLLTAFISSVILWYASVGKGWDEDYFGYRTLAIVGLLYTVVYYTFSKIYKANKIGQYHGIELVFSQFLSFGIANILLIGSTFFWFHNFKRIDVLLFVKVYIIQIMLMVLFVFVFNRIYGKIDNPRKIVIVYSNDSYKLLVQKMRNYKNRYDIIDCINCNQKTEDLFNIIYNAEDVYICDVDPITQNKILQFCALNKIYAHYSIKYSDIDVFGSDLSHFFDTPFLKYKPYETVWYYPIIKRIFDVLFSLLAIILLMPIYIIIAIIIKIDDRGSIFYKQTRLTKNGKRFSVIKFRSMKENSEDTVQLAKKDDDRITRVGKIIRKFRLDETPQFFNVLKGDMSIVGPRPERPELSDMIQNDLPEFNTRLKVKAGLTGYAQVYGNYSTIPIDKLKLDLLYIANRSIMLDMKIIFCTIKIVFISKSSEGL